MDDGPGWVADERATAGSCPACGAVDVRPILYGYPMADDVERLSGQVEFAGCCIPPDPPRFRCGSCAAAWGGWRDDSLQPLDP